MMKQVGSMLAIVLVVALLTAGVYLLVENGSSGAPAAHAEGSAPAGQPEFRGHSHEESASLGMGLAGILQKLGVIAFITLAVALVQKVIRPRRQPMLTNSRG